MRRPSWILVVALCLISGLAGLAWATLSDRPEEAYREARHAFRTALGLPKFWVHIPGPEQADGRSPIDCPDASRALVVVTGGQSNAANAVPVAAPTPPENEVAVWFDGKCWPAADPMLGASAPLPGSLWPPLAQGLAEATGRPVLLINGAIGGTQVADWLDDRSGYYAALKTRVEAARAAGYEPKLIIWHQGETDAEAEHDMSKIEAGFSELSDRLLADMPEAKLYLFRASKCIGAERANGVAGVREAQTAAAEGNDRVVAGMNTDELGNNFRWDTCHFNSLGRDAITTALLPELESLLGDAKAN